MNEHEVRDRIRRLGDPTSLLVSFVIHSPLAVQVFQKDGHSLFVNDPFRAIFGSTPPPEYNVFTDDQCERLGILPIIRRAFGGEAVHLPATWYDPRDLKSITVAEGRRCAIEVNMVPLFDANGEVGFVLMLYQERTEELLAKERLDRERQRSAVIAESTTEGLMLFESVRDPNTSCIVDFAWLFANTAGAAVVRRPAKALVGARMLDVLPGNVSSGLFDAYCALVERNEPLSRVVHYQHDGIAGRFRLTAVKVDDGFLATFAEVSAEMLAVEAAAAERDRLIRTLLHLPASVCVRSGPELRFEFINDEYRRQVGGRVVLGKTFAEAFPELCEKTADRMREVHQSGEPFTATNAPVRLAGDAEDRFFNVSYQPLRDANGHTDAVLSVAFEVTDQVRQNQAAAEYGRRLRGLTAAARARHRRRARAAMSPRPPHRQANPRHRCCDRDRGRTNDVLLDEPVSGRRPGTDSGLPRRVAKTTRSTTSIGAMRREPRHRRHDAPAR